MGSPRIQRYNPMPVHTKCVICGKLAKRTQRFVNTVAKIDVFFCSLEHKSEYIRQLQNKERKKMELVANLEII